MTRLSSFLALALVSFSASVPLQAKDVQATFRYDPVELKSAEGASAVYKRLRLTAKRVCEAPSPIQKRQQYDCQRDIENDLVAQIDSPVIISMHKNAQRVLRVAKAD